MENVRVEYCSVIWVEIYDISQERSSPNVREKTRSYHVSPKRLPDCMSLNLYNHLRQNFLYYKQYILFNSSSNSTVWCTLHANTFTLYV
jgi:hypothetical protein